MSVLGFAGRSFGAVELLPFAPTWNAHTFSTQFIAEILPSATAFFGGNWHVQLDNATAHRSQATQQALLQNGVPDVFFQPVRSLDMNPTENICALMKRRVVARGAQDVHQLRLTIIADWVALFPAEVEPFCSSISHISQDLITIQGSHTKN